MRYALGRCRGRAVEREAPMGGSVQVRRREGREGEKGELRPKEEVKLEGRSCNRERVKREREQEQRENSSGRKEMKRNERELSWCARVCAPVCASAGPRGPLLPGLLLSLPRQLCSPPRTGAGQADCTLSPLSVHATQR